MSADTIFSAFSTVEAVWSEIDRLSDAVTEAFAPNLALTYDHAEADDTLPNSRYGYHYRASGITPRQRTPAQLLLACDLVGPEAVSDWVMSQTALITIAYAPNFDAGWELPQVLLGTDGRLKAPTIAADCVTHLDDRLLRWNEALASWARSSWLFSVPLLSLDGLAAVRCEIVTPVLTLLRAADGSIDPFAGTAAVTLAASAAEQA